ncbi:helix-turn-helix domain-containing protein [Rhodococcus sp. NPDC059968]|uniref:helix-turn-helix domain-containing protein n=1 Tax=Rhodococcus sp. NPDC059968 TaxID=3347017 RepID=UPI00366C147A
MTDIIELRPGARIWFDGTSWEVVTLHGCEVTLRSGEALQRVAVAELAGRGIAIAAAPVDGPDPAAVVLTSLTAAQRRELEVRAEHVRSLLSGAQSDDATLKSSLAAKADELQVSVRTLQRWIAGYRAAGVAGLADTRVRSRYAASVDTRWDAACVRVLDGYVEASTPTMRVIIDAVARELEIEFGPGVVPLPSRSTAYTRLKTLSKGRYAFGSAKGRRSVADRPTGVFGRLRATRPGEYVVLDTTPLDVFAMEPITMRWVGVELTVAMDLFTRCVLGLRLSPVSTESRDVANVLFQCVSADRNRDDDGWPYHGVPRNLLVGTEEPDGLSQQRVGDLPACLPEAIVVDHGKQYLSDHVIGVCARLGITVQPAIPHKPTDKPTVERFFRTLRESLLQHLPAYKGPDVYSRGKDVEDKAFYYVSELEQIIREWVGSVYHRTQHDGLCVPEIPRAEFCPAEMFEIGVAKSGGLLLPSSPDLAYEFLEVRWRMIHHYGVEVDGLRYDGAGLNLYRGTRSPYGGVHAGKWPIFVDSHDVRHAYFQDPDTRQWHRLVWEHGACLHQPFSADAVDYAKRVSVREHRHLDPHRAVQDLLIAWSRQEVETRRDRSLARRLSAQRPSLDGDSASGAAPGGESGREDASVPGVIDLLEHLAQRSASPLEVPDDLDVFEQYYAQRPDEEAFGVFDE